MSEWRPERTTKQLADFDEKEGYNEAEKLIMETLEDVADADVMALVEKVHAAAPRGIGAKSALRLVAGLGWALRDKTFTGYGCACGWRSLPGTTKDSTGDEAYLVFGELRCPVCCAVVEVTEV